MHEVVIAVSSNNSRSSLMKILSYHGNVNVKEVYHILLSKGIFESRQWKSVSKTAFR